MYYPEHSPQIKSLVEGSQRILVLQAGNPDGDSLASALALEQILGELGKDVVLYCSVDPPVYLRHLEGWDRVVRDVPSQFDLAILVDTSAVTLLDNDDRQGDLSSIKTKPLIVFDHHVAVSTIDYADCLLNDKEAVATGQVIYQVSKDNAWPLDNLSATFIASSILSDTLGLTNAALTDNPQPFLIMADLVGLGLNINELNQKRIEASKIEPELVKFKGELLQRVEFSNDNSIASITIDHEEIKASSHKYNPTVVLDELRFVKDVKVTLGFKEYLDKKGACRRLTCRIRCMYGIEIAQDLAQAFGGDGHVYASGIKIEGDNLDTADFKAQVIAKATELLN